MATSYQELFSIECLHGYFTDRLCRVLELSPTPECESMLQRYQLLFRRTAAGGKVLYSVQDGVDRLPLYDETAPFSFNLVNTDPLFDTYTDGTVERTASVRDTIRYFSNREENVADVFDQQRLLLHPAGQPFAQPALPVRPQGFTHTFAQPVTAARLKVLNVLRRQPVWEAQTPEQAVQAWNIDLHALPSGRYVLTTDDAETNDAAALDFYLSEAPAANQWGVIEIFPGGPNQAAHIPQASQVIDAAGLPQARNFTIALARRQTFWRYYVFDPTRPDSSEEDYKVIGKSKRGSTADSAEATDIQFTRRDESVTLNGRRAVVFESEQAVGLSQIPGDEDYQFMLQESGRSDQAARRTKLPFAQPAATRLEAAAGGTRMCSEIFVYL